MEHQRQQLLRTFTRPRLTHTELLSMIYTRKPTQRKRQIVLLIMHEIWTQVRLIGTSVFISHTLSLFCISILLPSFQIRRSRLLIAVEDLSIVSYIFWVLGAKGSLDARRTSRTIIAPRWTERLRAESGLIISTLLSLSTDNFSFPFHPFQVRRPPSCGRSGKGTYVCLYSQTSRFSDRRRESSKSLMI